MERQSVERSFGAIPTTGMGGYSPLMRGSEAGARAQIKSHGKELIDPRNLQAGPAASFRKSPPGCKRRSSHLQSQLSKLCRAVAIAVVLLGLNPTLAVSGAAATAERIRQTAQEILSGADYQRELPLRPRESLPEGAGSPPSSRLEANGPDDTMLDAREGPRDEVEPRPGPGDELVLPEGFRDAGRLLLWVLVFAGAALLVLYLLNELPLLARRVRNRGDRGAVPEPRSGGAEAARPEVGDSLGEADRLAREGNYREAVHVLLLRSIEELRTRLDIALAESLTSREILQDVPLTERARSALAPIVTVVELSHFGGRTSSEMEYRACREHYRRFAVPRSGAA